MQGPRGKPGLPGFNGLPGINGTHVSRPTVAKN